MFSIAVADRWLLLEDVIAVLMNLPSGGTRGHKVLAFSILAIWSGKISTTRKQDPTGLQSLLRIGMRKMDGIQANGTIQLLKAGSPTQVCCQAGTPNLSKITWCTNQIYDLAESSEPSSNSENSSNDSAGVSDAGVSDAGASKVGAIAGGVAGGSVGALLIAALLWYFLCRGRRSRTKSPIKVWDKDEYTKAELQAESALKRVSEAHELDPHAIGAATAMSRTRQYELP